MSTSPPDTNMPATNQSSNGLATYFKVLYAPGEAFSTLARVPTWGWAAIIGIILTVVATAIGVPAILHLIQAGQEKAIQQLPADQAATQRAVLAKVPQALYIALAFVQGLLIPWFAWLIGAVVFLIGASLSGGEARFKSAWVCALNLYIIGAVGAVATYVIVALRGAANVSSSADLYALPSLAMLVPGSVKLQALLYSFNLVNIWYYIVAVIALEQVMKMSRTAAIVTVLVLAVLGGCLGGAFAK
jgi:hypothetical protein